MTPHDQRAVGLWRYPVKGLLGEPLTAATFDQRGLVGDRTWAIVGTDGKFASGKTTRRFRRMPNLFTMSARTTEDGDVAVTVDGWEGSVRSAETAARVSEVVGEPVTLEPEGDVPHHDEGGVHLLSTASLRFVQGIDVRRLRPNVLIEQDGDEPREETWIGEKLTIDSVEFRVTARMPRCVMVTLRQADLAFAPSLLRQIEAANDGYLGVVAEVGRQGVIHCDG